MSPVDVINWLNKLLEVDRPSISRLFEMRQACNNPLAEMPRVQTAFNKSLGVPTIGVLGILNSLFETVPDGKYKGWGQIVALKDEHGTIEKFVHVSDMD